MRRKIVANDVVFNEVVEIIAQGESVVLLTKGNSMLPFIVGERDSVELSPVSEELKIGDIVLARTENPTRYVIHRIVEINNEVVTLMGDGNILGREWCTLSDIAALVTAIIKPKKRVDPNSRSQRFWAKVWRVLCPVRRYLLAIRRRLC